MSAFGHIAVVQLLDPWNVIPLQKKQEANILDLKFSILLSNNNQEPTPLSYTIRNKQIDLDTKFKIVSQLPSSGFSRGPVFEFTLQVRLTNAFKSGGSSFNSIVLSSKSLDVTKRVTEENVWQFAGKKEFIEHWELDINILLDNVPKIHAFPALFGDNEFTDFELCGDDGSVGVHRVVLATWSPVLHRMLSGDWRETNVRQMNVCNTSKVTLQHLKEYMYLHKLPDDFTELQQLLLFASSYMMPELEQNCADKLINAITKENAMDLFKFAADYNIVSIIADIFEFAYHDIAIDLRKQCTDPINVEASDI